ncbi:MAG: DUF2834 domain-containing protein [Rhodocyclaceae bacterium]|nr:DUF2834 domain-containing protein [Rhodocyclaceae bacterium]
MFGALSIEAIIAHGFIGIFMSPLQSLASTQIFCDLLISLTLVLIWMWHDAKANGRNIWPWIIATLAVGSFGPLVYLLTRKSTKPA